MRMFYLAYEIHIHLNNHVNQLFLVIWAILAEKNEDKVYVNQDESLTDLQTLIKYSIHFF